MTQRIVHPTLSFGQLRLLEQIQKREMPPRKPIIRTEFLACALLGLALGFAGSVYFLSSQVNGLDVVARMGVYSPPSSHTASRN